MEYLYYVGVEDCVNIEQQWKQGFQLVKPVPDTHPRKVKKKRNPRINKLGNTPAVVEVGKLTKTETKALREVQRWVVRTYSLSDNSKEEVAQDQLNLPSAFKRYTIQDRTILRQKPKRQKPLENEESYEGLEDAKQFDLALDGEEP